MRMEWRRLLFAHWPVDPADVRPWIPSGLELDTFDGRAWIGIVPFTMRAVLPAAVPTLPGLADLPALTAFHECNLRTYVSFGGRPGVWFFSLDAESPPAVRAARRWFHLPYRYARFRVREEDGITDYAFDRAEDDSIGLRCRWRAGRPLPRTGPGDLAHFLTDRLRLFSADPRERLHEGRIAHAPWALREAELLDFSQSLTRPFRIPLVAGPPLLHHADVLQVKAWALERVGP